MLVGVLLNYQRIIDTFDIFLKPLIMLSSLSRQHARVLRRMSNQIFASAKNRSTKAAFFEDAVQTELKALTGLSYDKIFR